MFTPLYAIMDQRAYQDVDRALIMSVQSEQQTLDDVRHERDQSWPGYPIVNLATWEILPEEKRTSGAPAGSGSPLRRSNV